MKFFIHIDKKIIKRMNVWLTIKNTITRSSERSKSTMKNGYY